MNRNEFSPGTIARIVRLLHDLSNAPEGVTVENIMQWSKSSRRTVFRDLARLRQAGFCLIYDPDRGHYRIAQESQKAAISGTASQVGANWPLEWDDFVALFALLDLTVVPPGSELALARERIRGKASSWIGFIFGSRASSIVSNAGLLARSPTLSISAMRERMESFWAGSDSGSGATHANTSDSLTAPVPSSKMAPFISCGHGPAQDDAVVSRSYSAVAQRA